MAPHFVTCVQPTYSFELLNRHTHTHSLRLTQKTYNTPLHRRRHHHHQTTNQTSGIWGLAVVQARMQAGDTIKQQQQHAILPPVWLEWMKKREKQASEGSVLWQAERMHGVLGMNGLVVFWRIVRGFAGTRKINECVRSTVWASLWGREWMKFTWISRLCRQDGFETTPSWLRDGEAINNNEWAHSWT